MAGVRDLMWKTKDSQAQVGFGIWYSASISFDLVGFFDADFMGCEIDRKSTSGT
jgi:hypothetical protein